MRIRLTTKQELWWIILLPMLIKLFTISPIRLFEAHDIALEMIDSGEMRYWLHGQWNWNYQFPVYPSIAFVVYSLGLGVYGMLVVNVLFGAASAWLAYAIATKLNTDGLYKHKVGILAALLTGLHPFLGYYQVQVIHPFALDMFLGMWLLYLSLTVCASSFKHMVLLGVVAGIAMLDRTTLGVFALPFVLREWRTILSVKHFQKALLAVILALAPTTAWLWRNHQIYGEWSLNSSTGQNLWIGIQERSEGTAQLPNGDSYLTLLNDDERDSMYALPALEKSAFFIQKWQQELNADGTLWWRMMAVKLKNFWFFRTHLGIDHDGRVTKLISVVYQVSAFLLFVFAISALFLRKRLVNYVLFTLLVLSVLQALYYVETRHKLLIDPVLMIVALIVLTNVMQRNVQKMR